MTWEEVTAKKIIFYKIAGVGNNGTINTNKNNFISNCKYQLNKHDY